MRSRPRSPIVAPIVGILFALVWSFSAPAAPALAEQAFERVLAGFNASSLPSYRALRHMEAGIHGSENQGSIEVWTEYQPARGLVFDVVREAGSDYVRNKVLRKLLFNEQQLLAGGKPLRAPLEPRNYSFEDGGVTDGGLQRINLTAARRADGVINGALFIDPGNDRIVRMQGRLVKSPSFWVRDVDVTWNYARVGDHILPVEMTTTGRVRFYGRSYFNMTYDYASVDGRPAGTIRAELR